MPLKPKIFFFSIRKAITSDRHKMKNGGLPTDSLCQAIENPELVEKAIELQGKYFKKEEKK
jgi:hypothetical protein